MEDAAATADEDAAASVVVSAAAEAVEVCAAIVDVAMSDVTVVEST